MRQLHVRIDGTPLGTLGGQLDGNSLVVNALTPAPRATRRGGTRRDHSSRRASRARRGGAATLAAICAKASWVELRSGRDPPEPGSWRRDASRLAHRGRSGVSELGDKRILSPTIPPSGLRHSLRTWASGHPLGSDPARRLPGDVAALCRRLIPADLHRPAFQHGPRADAQDAADSRGRGRRPGRLRGTTLFHATARRELLRDSFDDYLAFLAPRLEQAHRLLAREGTLYFHIDYREAHYCKLLLDEIFGRECFLNELIWAYDYGARSRRRWPSKHDTILVYVTRSGRLLLRRRGGRPRALHGARPRHAREGRARQATDRRLVAHDRSDQRRREDWLSDAEAGGHRAAHGACQ